jgi:PAS domain-containing protein
MSHLDWTKAFPGSIIICDLDGIILEMNERAEEVYRKDGGRDLIGKSLIDCHPEPARSKLMRILKTGERNVYTTERNGIKKFIYQAPWYQNARLGGMVELAFEIPFDIPNFIRT